MTVAPSLAVILAAGRGTRMQADAAAVAGLDAAQRAEAGAGRKMLIPFGGRPFLAWVLDAVGDAGFTEACIVLGTTTEDLPSRLTHPLPLAFAMQAEPRGTADAVLAAERVTGGRPFAVINGDNWYPADALRLLRSAPPPATVGFRPDDRAGAFALMQASRDGCLEQIVEKPDAAAQARMASKATVSMTCWSFTSAIFDACRAVSPSPRGEYELPDAVRLLARDGTCVRVLPHDGPVLDLSRAEDVPAVARALGA